MSKRSIFISFPILLLLGLFFLGPEPAKPNWNKQMPVVPQEPAALENYIATGEGKHHLKPNNEARIVWADSGKAKTPYSIVYLHGFSASQMEGDPVHRDFAKKFGCNMYLARLADHGIDTVEALLNFTVDRYWETSKEALAIGKAIGDKVILVSTSTGGTLALILAGEYPDDVYALINLSPNISLYRWDATLLDIPWGLQIARQILGSKYIDNAYQEARWPYWNNVYRIEALTQLQELLDDKMNKDTFAKVKQPSLTLYWYKNEKVHDSTVSVSAMLDMEKVLNTPDSLKMAIPVPEAGAHVLGSSLTSKDIKTVEMEMEKFALEKLSLKRAE